MRLNRRSQAAPLTLAALAALALAACGQEEEASSSGSPGTTSSDSAAEENEASADDVFVGAIGVREEQDGVEVRTVELGTPIDNSRLLTGDVITGVDGAPVSDAQDLVDALDGLAGSYDPGDRFELEVVRGEGERTAAVTLAANVYLGAGVADAPKDIGMVVNDVQPGQPAAAAGVKRGDVIAGIDNEPVADGEDLAAALETHLAGDEVDLQIARRSRKITIPVTLKKRVQGEPKVMVR